MNVQIRNVCWLRKATGVIALVAVEFTELGLRLNDVPVLLHQRRLSVALPKRRTTDAKGRTTRTSHHDQVSFRTSLVAAEFSATVLGEIERLYPGVLTGHLEAGLDYFRSPHFPRRAEA